MRFKKIFAATDRQWRTILVTCGALAIVIASLLLLPFLLASVLNAVFGALWAATILAQLPSGLALLTIAFISRPLRSSYRLTSWILAGPVIGEICCVAVGTEIHQVTFIDAGYVDICWAAALIGALCLYPRRLNQWMGPLVMFNFATTRTAQAATALTAMETNEFVSGIWIPLTMYMFCITFFTMVALTLSWLVKVGLRMLRTPIDEGISPPSAEGFGNRERIAALLLVILCVAGQIMLLIEK